MEKGNKKKSKTERKKEGISLEKTVEEIAKDETTESNESINDIDKLPGNGFGRVLGCG